MKFIRFFPVGGLGEIGSNCYVYEFEDAAFIVDCGLLFSNESMYGVDFVVSNESMFDSVKHKIKALFITHTHEDHIGGIAYTLKNIDCPIYATMFASKVIKHKLKENNIESKKFVIVDTQSEFEISGVKVKTIPMIHSTVEPVSYAFKSSKGWVVHMSDFRFDKKNKFNIEVVKHLKKLGKEGCYYLSSDSTNVEKTVPALSEIDTKKNLIKLLKYNKGINFVALFPTNINRISHVLEAAKMHKKKVFLSGRSMMDLIGFAKESGYLTEYNEYIKDLSSLSKYKRGECIVLSTGTQGEYRSSLFRISLNENKDVKILPKDRVLFSSRVIPGNEKEVSRMIDNIYKLGGEVFKGDEYKIHSTGHANYDDLKLLISYVKPKNFIPCHGEYRHLFKHKALAKESGLKEKNIFLLSNGESIDVLKGKILEKVELNRVFIESEGHGEIGASVLKERKKISDNGIVFLMMVREKSSGKLSPLTRVVARGVVEEEKLEKLSNTFIRELDRLIIEYKTGDFIEFIRIGFRRVLKKHFKKKPVVVPVICEI